MLEAWVKDRVKRVLKKRGVFYFMPMQMYGRAGVTDFVIVHCGLTLFLETKATPKHKVSAGQRTFMDDARKAGAFSLIIHSHNIHKLVEWLDMVEGDYDASEVSIAAALSRNLDNQQPARVDISGAQVRKRQRTPGQPRGTKRAAVAQ